MSATIGDNEDAVPVAYKYSWSPSSEISLDQYLNQAKPSMIKNDGTKPWIWCHSGRDRPERDEQAVIKAISEAQSYLTEVAEQVESIKNDDSIPARGSKKTGAKGKKEVREAVQAEAYNKLKAIALENGYVDGKWLIFASSDRVDSIWSTICKSLVSGPLKDTPAIACKVATTPAIDQPNYQHVLCIYLADIYDKDAVTQVMKVLLKNHGMKLSGCKSDLNTRINLDSKHPSGVQSTVWKTTDLLAKDEQEAMVAAYWTEVETSKKEALQTAKEAAGVDQPKLQAKKKGPSDPFESDSEDEVMEKAKLPAAKPATGGTKRKNAEVEEEGDKGQEDTDKPKAPPAKKKKPAKKVF